MHSTLQLLKTSGSRELLHSPCLSLHLRFYVALNLGSAYYVHHQNQKKNTSITVP